MATMTQERRELSKDELTEAEECFLVFSQNGRLAVGDLSVALRSFGLNPSNKDVAVVVKELGVSSISLSDFKGLLTQKRLYGSCSREEIQEAFGIFDRNGNGTISARELRHILMSTGEKLSEEEVNLMILQTDVDEDGEIQYEQFIKIMTEK